MRSLLAVRRGGLGDLLVILPSLRLLRFAFPEACITLVARAVYGRPLLEAGVVDRIEEAGEFRWAALADSDSGEQPQPLPLPGPLAVLGWFHSETGGSFARNASALWPDASVRSLTVSPAAGRPLNRSFFDLTGEFVAASNRPLSLFEECARLPYPRRVPAGRYAVIHPGSGGRSKIWPLDHYLEVVRFLAEEGFAGTVVTGEAEEFLENRLAETALPPGWGRLSKPALSDLMRLLSDATIYLGNDSGVTHLAAVLGVPGLAVFRTEFAAAWRPGGNIGVVSADDVREIPTGAVWAELTARGLISPENLLF